MRLLKLRWKNVNSLAGEYRIDFRDPAYRQSGIFAITGPTGSGKSSVLDAVSLALFAETPRTRAESGGGEDCMVMTKGRSVCEAAVVFEVSGGVYLSRWSQHRAKKSAKLQPASVELVRLAHPDDDAGEVLAEKKTEWTAAVTRVTGLTFATFTKSVLLAQGAFANFLRAKEDERAEILEKITGTTLYSEVGRRVFEREKEERLTLEDLETELERNAPLEPQARAALDDEWRRTQAEAVSLDEKGRRLRAVLTALREARASDEAARESARLLAAARAAKAASLPKEERLRAAKRARGAETERRLFEDVRRDAEALRVRSVRTAQEEERAHLVQEKARAEVGAASKALEAARAACDAFLPKADAMRAADETLRTLRTTQAEREREAKSARAAAEGAQRALEGALREAQAAETALAESEAQLKGTAPDAALPEALSAIRLAVRAHAEARLAFGREEKALEALDETHAKDAERLEASERAAAEARAACDEAKRLLAAAEKDLEIASAGKGLEQSLLEMRRGAEAAMGARWALSLAREAERARTALSAADLSGNGPMRAYLTETLEDVARTTDELRALAPDALANLSPEGVARLDAALEDLRSWSRDAAEAQKRRERLAKTLVGREAERAEADAALERERRAQEASRTERSRLEGSLARARTALEEARIAYLRAVEPFVAEAERTRAPKTVLKALEDRSLARTSAETAAVRERESVSRTRAALGPLKTQADEAASALANRKALFDEARTASEAAEAERRRRWGETDPKAETERLEALAREAERVRHGAQTACAAADVALARVRETLAEVRLRLEESQKDEAKRRSDFEAALVRAGFADEAAYAAAVLPAEELERLEGEVRLTDERLTAAEAAHAQAERRSAAARGALTALNLSEEPSIEPLEAELGLSEKSLAALREAVGGLAERRRTDDERRRGAEETLRRIEAQRVRKDAWTKLLALIGDREGKGFRKAAQKLTFAMLLENANGILANMQSRYRLEPAGASGLETAVRDEDLAGIVRTSANLSGGETFLVSLALALALARISTKNLRVDTLFLDEGFGSLDPQTLERALSALETLQRDSQKLIGLISHVRAVSERVPAHITVRPKGATGESEVTGPGVERIA